VTVFSPEWRARTSRILERRLEFPMLGLALVWLTLLVLELVQGLSPLLEGVGAAIWGIFLLEFLVRFALSLDRLAFLRRNWLVAISLFVPPLRVLRILVALRFVRLLSAARFLRVVRIAGSLNRGIRSIGRKLQKRGLAYVLIVTIIMLLVLAAGIYSYEGPQQSGMLSNYGESLWVTAVIMTTLGPDLWPQSWEARVLSLFAGIIGFAVFGYLTAALASFFVGREKLEHAAVSGDQDDRLATLQASIDRLTAQLEEQTAGEGPDQQQPGDDRRSATRGEGRGSG